MHRELGDERARYGTKTLREQLVDAASWPAGHRFATVVILLVVVGALVVAAAQGRPQALTNLRLGDCLYVPTDAALDPTAARPIGDDITVEQIVVAGGAQKADCTASHGHEVSALLTGPEPSARPGALGAPFDRDAIHRVMQPLCESAFPSYVGHALSGSVYVTFPAVPEASAWVAGGRRTVCLVARRDGAWMDHPARGSGE